jgi:hypothetical protein
MADNTKTGTNTQQDDKKNENTDPVEKIESGDIKIYLGNDPLDITLNDIIINEKIVVPLNENSKNLDVKEFTKFLLQITDSKNLKQLYEKIVYEDWKNAIEKIFSIGRSPRDKLEIVADPNNTTYGYKKYCIDVTLKLIIPDPEQRTKLDQYLDSTTQSINISVIRFVFNQNENIYNDDLAVRVGLIGYAYIDRLAAEEYKKKLEDAIMAKLDDNPVIIREINKKILSSANKAEPQKTEEKTINDVIKGLEDIKKTQQKIESVVEQKDYKFYGVIFFTGAALLLAFALYSYKGTPEEQPIIKSRISKKQRDSLLSKMDAAVMFKN